MSTNGAKKKKERKKDQKIKTKQKNPQYQSFHLLSKQNDKERIFTAQVAYFLSECFCHDIILSTFNAFLFSPCSRCRLSHASWLLLIFGNIVSMNQSVSNSVSLFCFVFFKPISTALKTRNLYTPYCIFKQSECINLNGRFNLDVTHTLFTVGKN